jgi:hypothetical protein
MPKICALFTLAYVDFVNNFFYFLFTERTFYEKKTLKKFQIAKLKKIKVVKFKDQFSLQKQAQWQQRLECYLL